MQDTLLPYASEASGPSGPSTKVSHLREELPTADALQILYTDATGVELHKDSKFYASFLITLYQKLNIYNTFAVNRHISHI